MLEKLNNNLETTNANLDSLSKMFNRTSVGFTINTTNADSTSVVSAYKIGNIVYVNGYIKATTNTGLVDVGTFSEIPIANTQCIAQIGDPASPYCTFGNVKIDGVMNLKIQTTSTAYRFNFCYITN